VSSFGSDSLAKLAGCHEEIVRVCWKVIPIYDFTVVWGARGEASQNLAFSTGFSTKPWPLSKHNAIAPELSDAIDIAPWHRDKPHIRWPNEREFIYLAGHIMQAAADWQIKIRWGGDWDSDRDLYDTNKPFDLGHFERST